MFDLRRFLEERANDVGHAFNDAGNFVNKTFIQPQVNTFNQGVQQASRLPSQFQAPMRQVQNTFNQGVDTVSNTFVKPQLNSLSAAIRQIPQDFNVGVDTVNRNVVKPIQNEYNRGAQELDRLGGGMARNFIDPIKGAQNAYGLAKPVQEGIVKSGGRLFNEATKPFVGLATGNDLSKRGQNQKGLLETLSGGNEQDLLNTQNDQGIRGQITRAVIGQKPMESFGDINKRWTEAGKQDQIDVLGLGKVKNPQFIKDNPQLAGVLGVAGITAGDLSGYGSKGKGVKTIAETGLKNPKAYEVIANILKKDHGIVDEALTNKLINVNKADDVKNAIQGFKKPVENVYKTTDSALRDLTKDPERFNFLKSKGYTGFESSTLKLDSKGQIAGGEVINSVNPTGGLLVDYNPKARMTTRLGENMTTLDKTSGKKPDDIVTIYRGAPKNQKTIAPGDFITTNYDSAKSYIGQDGHILEKNVPMSHILDDATEPLGEDYLYRPSKTPISGVKGGEKAISGEVVGKEDAFLNNLDKKAQADAWVNGNRELNKIATQHNQPQLLEQFQAITQGKTQQEKADILSQALRNYRDRGGAIWSEMKSGNVDIAGKTPTETQNIADVLFNKKSSPSNLDNIGKGEIPNPIRDVLNQKLLTGGTEPLNVNQAKRVFKKTGEAPDFVNPVKGSKKPLVTKQPIEDIPLDTFNPNQYVKEQSKIQEVARKAESTGIIGGVKKGKAEIKEKFIDIYSPIEDTVRNAQKKGQYEILPKNNIHYQIDRVLRSEGLAGQFVKDHGFDKIIQKTSNLKELDQYLIAQRSVELADRGIETGRNLAKDKALVASLSSKYGQDSQAVHKYSQDILQYATDSGLISKDAQKALLRDNPNYVPVQRIMDEINGVPVSNGGVASLSSQSVVQKIKGSKREIESPLNSLINKTNDAFRQGEVNRAAKMLGSYEKLPGFEGLMREIPEGEKIGLKNTFSYLDNGIKRTFETTPEIAMAAKNLDAQTLGLLGRIFRMPVRVAKLGITGLRPAFTVANVARDQVSQIINSSKALKTSPANPKNFVASLFSALGHGKLFDEVNRNAGMQTSFDIFRNPAVTNLKKVRAGRNPASKVLYTVTHPGELLRAAENTIGRSEELTRIQAYRGTRNALSKSRTAEDAAILAAEAARTNTVNFARHGAYGKVLNSALLYINPAIQGSRTLVRNLKERPAQTMTKVALTTLTPVAIATAWALNDPKRKEAWDDIPEFEKENAIIIVPPNPTKDENGRWNVIKIPLSQEVARFTNTVRRPMEAAAGLDPVRFGEMASALLSVVSPVDTSSITKAASSIVPQAIKPTVEDLTNTNLFTRNKIVPENKKNLPPEMQVNDYTTSTAKKIGGVLNTSPLRVENFVRSTFGGLGSEALHYGDVAMNKAGIIPADQVKGTGSGEATLNRFSKASGGEIENRIYNKISVQNTIKSVENAYKKGEMTANDASNTINKILKNDKTQVRLPNGQTSGNSLQMDNGKTAMIDSSGQITISKDQQTANETSAKADFEKSGKAFQDNGDYVLKRSSSGSVTTQKKTAYNDDLYYQQMTSYKKKGDIKSWMSTAEKKATNLQEMLQDPTLDEVEKTKLQNNLDTLLSDAAKYQGYGGFTKGKSASGGKKGKGSAFKLPAVSVANTTASATYKDLQRLLKGTTSARSGSKTIGRKVALKKITINKKGA